MSTAATSCTAETTFLLSKWIGRAIDEVDLSALANGTSTGAAPDHPSQWPTNVRNSMALCSDEYLMSALRVARSLADGICEAEDNIAEKGGRDNNNNDDEIPPSLLPEPGINWADNVQRADFLPSGETPDSGGSSDEDAMRRIYSLGIVLYEIFSG
eukprot:scaffold286_cov125-Skeletonema_dohrnii-CCMP3373.AAC.1